jgi:hypothetical protein
MIVSFTIGLWIIPVVVFLWSLMTIYDNDKREQQLRTPYAEYRFGNSPSFQDNLPFHLEMNLAVFVFWVLFK